MKFSVVSYPKKREFSCHVFSSLLSFFIFISHHLYTLPFSPLLSCIHTLSSCTSLHSSPRLMFRKYSSALFISSSLSPLLLIKSHVREQCAFCHLSPLGFPFCPSSSIISPSFLHSHAFRDDTSGNASALTAVASSSPFLLSSSSLHPFLLCAFTSLHPLLHTSQTCHNVTSNTLLRKPHLHNQLPARLKT